MPGSGSSRPRKRRRQPWLNAEIVKVLSVPEVRSQFAGQGIETLGSTPEHFAGYIRDEIAKWAKVIQLSGAKAD